MNFLAPTPPQHIQARISAVFSCQPLTFQWLRYHYYGDRMGLRTYLIQPPIYATAGSKHAAIVDQRMVASMRLARDKLDFGRRLLKDVVT